MYRQASGVMALVACVGVASAPRGVVEAEEGPRLGIIICDAARVPVPTLAAARTGASRLFAQAGVEVDWLECSRDDVTDVKDIEEGIACHRPRHPQRLILEILRHPVAGTPLGRETGGFARLPRDGRRADCAGVFYDRAYDLARLGDATTAQILAHLVAHEVGHLLLGAGSHSQGGVMRPSWSREDMARAAWGRLTFEPDQARKLRAAALDRVAGSTSALD